MFSANQGEKEKAKKLIIEKLKQKMEPSKYSEEAQSEKSKTKLKI